MKINTNDLMINEEIRDREVRVIGQDGEQLGIMATSAALALAEEKQLDLVKIAPQAKPPVCKIMDYGKYRFEQSKREREMRKNQKVIVIKEVQLSATIEEHDIDGLKVRARVVTSVQDWDEDTYTERELRGWVEHDGEILLIQAQMKEDESVADALSRIVAGRLVFSAA